MRKIVILTAALIIALIFFSAALAVIFNPTQARFQTICIRPDGSIDPPTAPVKRDGNTYYLTSDIYSSPNVQSAFIVEKDNIVIDGAGYTLHGTYNGTKDVDWTVGQGPYNGTGAPPWTVGIDIADISLGNLTIRNLTAKNFSIGMFIWTSNNTIVDNIVVDNIVGIMVSESSNSFIGNYIANNDEGLFLAVNSAGCFAENMTSYHNSFVNNTKQVNGCQCTDSVENCTTYSTNIWDNGSEGNYWSDYEGTDEDGDGIGDEPYVIDLKNQDRYPLMECPVISPAANAEAHGAVFLAAIVSTVVAIAGLLLYFRKRNNH